MKILIGSQALRKLEIEYYGESDIQPNDTDLYVYDEPMTKIKGIDVIHESNKMLPHDDSLEIIKYINTRKPNLKEENDYYIADPIILSFVYLNRIRRTKYLKHIKCDSDIKNLHKLKNMFSDEQNEYMKSIIENNHVFNNWILYSDNKSLYKINFINKNVIIANDYAVMFYYEKYLNKELLNHTAHIDIYNNNVINEEKLYNQIITEDLIENIAKEKGKLDVIEFKKSANTLINTKIIGDQCEYNIFDLHKTFYIESISSLIEKYNDQEVVDNLKLIKETYNIK